MERMVERCAGLDVHQATVAACVRLPDAGRSVAQVVQSFGTTSGG